MNSELTSWKVQMMDVLSYLLSMTYCIIEFWKCNLLAISVFGQIVCTAMFLFPKGKSARIREWAWSVCRRSRCAVAKPSRPTAKLYKITETTKIITVKIYAILRKFKENVWWFNCKWLTSRYEKNRKTWCLYMATEWLAWVPLGLRGVAWTTESAQSITWTP